MKANEFQQFKTIVAGMAALYGRIESLDDGLMDVYWLALKDWPLEEFQRAASHLLRTSTFMPRPADFERLGQGSAQSARQAWADVVAWVRASGYRSALPKHLLPPEPSQEAVRAVMILGGWEAISLADISELGFLEKRFLEHFEDARASQGQGLPSPPEGPRLNGPVSIAELLGPKDG